MSYLCALFTSIMSDYKDESGKGYSYDDSVGSFEQDLVYALDARIDIVDPSSEVAECVQAHICNGFEKDDRSRLRYECPWPDFLNKVTETPEIDQTLVTHLKKFSKDPKKGIYRA
ncbi:hypothetical protein NDU88_004587 [Pleurodeles waltl]|uniref:Uncharacterized protein n=1 Tax=Pleurodeles waltl TaxID=8319 RepID=A0AAV7L958_PLEWA|nr:hypothetical protein NDU88_004587 [Pleurodeles waltl]